MPSPDDLARFAAEWPTYPLADLPAIPDDFQFYWSAMYPMFHAPALGLGVIVEYVNPAERENPEEPRFCLFADGPEPGDTPTDLIVTDNWNAILARIDVARKSAA